MEQNEKQGKWIARLKAVTLPGGAGYLTVKNYDGKLFHGGNQNWWLKQNHLEALKKKGEKKGKFTPYGLCRKDEDYRLARLGCGVIAINNLELYLLHGSGMSREEYETYVRNNWQGVYRIHSDYLNFKAGLYPWKMEAGLRIFLERINHSAKVVKWAPFWTKSRKIQKSLVIEEIKRMLDADIPVIFAYYTFIEQDSLDLYDSLQKALDGDPQDHVNSHYMTITGLYEYDLQNEKKYILYIESWGRMYYIRYDQFAAKLSYFNNILLVR